MPSTCRAIAVALFAAFTLNAPAGSAEEASPTIARTADWRTAVRQVAETNLKHPAWGASHSLRDHELAKELAAADKVTLDDDVLYAAAYLHDVAAFAPFRKDGVDHQDEAARIIDSLLADTGFPMSKIDAVRGAIGVAHVFGLVDPKGGSPTGPEAAARLEMSLAEVPPRVVSPAGKARVAQRVRELQEFLKALRGQSSDLRTL